MDANYDVKKVNVNVGGRILTGFASDGVVTVTKSEDAVTPNIGVQGDVVYEENANESGTIAITLMSTSPSVAYLRDIAINRKAVSVVVSDANSDGAVIANGKNCRVTKVPDITRGKSTATVTVNIFVPQLTIK